MTTTGAGITIEGLDDCIRWIDNAPESCMKATKAALKEAAKKTSQQIRRETPKRWRRLVRYKVIKTSSGKLNAGLGLFNGHQQQGHQNKNSKIDDWFKAYWANYGTLENRDPEHKFREPVKHAKTSAAKRRKNKSGQRAQRFFESSTKGFERTFTEALQEALKKNENTFYER